MQGIIGISTSTLGIDSSILSIPSASGLTSTQSFSGSSQASSINIPIAPVVPQLSPAIGNEVDLVLTLDTNGLMLTMQCPLVCLVIWNLFDILCILLTFINTFPNAPLAIRFVKDTLLYSALNYIPCIDSIYQHLLDDGKYMCKIVPLVSHMSTYYHLVWNYQQLCARISIYWYKVKEFCYAMIELAMLAIGLQAEIARYVKRQL